MTDRDIPNGTFGILRTDAPFRAIFPDGFVPLKSLIPFIPREAGSPPCYEVDGDRLTDLQRQQLAADLFNRWRPECESIEAAIAYISDPGLPLQIAWFHGFTTTDFIQLLPLLGVCSGEQIDADDAVDPLRALHFDDDDDL